MYSTSHAHHLSLHRESSLKNVKPELKILSTFLIVLTIAFSDVQNIFQVISHSLIVFTVLYLSNIPLKTYLKRLTIDIPFIIFALFLPFLSSENNDIVYTFLGLNIFKTGLLDMFAILFKATLGLTMGIFLTAVTSNIELIYGLQFIDEFKRVKTSMRSRGYKEKGIKTLIPIAYASGAMLIRGYERGERVYLSMISRGFNGSIELKERNYKNSIILNVLTIASIIVLIVDTYL